MIPKNLGSVGFCLLYPFFSVLLLD